MRHPGRDPLLLQIVAEVVMEARELDVPMVVDADGLYLVNQHPELIKVSLLSIASTEVILCKVTRSASRIRTQFSLQGYERAILTPNRAEFARLMKTIGTLRHLCLSN